MNYYIACTMNFYNGMPCDSLPAALEKVRQLLQLHPGRLFDIMRKVDRDNVRVVWTCDSAQQGYTRSR
jgi:hypothetical protein